MELVTVVTVGVGLLGEKMTLERAVGGALIVAGVVGYGLLRSPKAAPTTGDSGPIREQSQTARRVRTSG